MGKINKAVKTFFIGLIRLYQLFIGVLLRPCCRFYPSCSHYAIDALRTHHIFRAFFLILLRILRCHPWHPGGHDPVPEPTKLFTRDDKTL